VNENTQPQLDNHEFDSESTEGLQKPGFAKSLWFKLFPSLCAAHKDGGVADYVPHINQAGDGETSQLENLDRDRKTDSPNLQLVADMSSVIHTRREPQAMTKRLTVVSKKGGVGKSTLVMALAGHFSSNGEKVLICDLDAQCTASQNCLTKQVAAGLPGDKTIAALFDNECEVDADAIIHESHLDNIWVLPSNIHFETHLDPNPLKAEPALQLALSQFLDEVESHFDWVIIDSPPALGNLGGWNCLTAAHYAISPVQMEGYSAQTVVGVEDAIANALSFGNPSLQFLGYVVSEFDKTRKDDHVKSEQALRARYGQQVFDSVIFRRAKLPQSQNADSHIHKFAPRSNEAKMVDGLASELIARIEKSTASRRAA